MDATTKKQEEQISAELALYDAMDNVLRHLNVRDLCRVAQVCKSWNEDVRSEFTKRRGPERILIPDTYDAKYRRIPSSGRSRFHVFDTLKSKPDIALLFCGPRPHLRSALDLEYNIMSVYKPQFPGRLLVLGLDASMMDQKEIRSCPSDFTRKHMANGILGLFLSEYRNLRLKIAHCESHEFEISKKARRLVRELMPENRHEKSTILLFGRSYYTTPKLVMKGIKKKFEPNTYTVWGGTTHNFLKIIDCREDDYPSYKGMEGCVGIRITGTTLESHSTIVDCNLGLRKSVVQKHLADFRDGLTLRRRTLGLLCGPRRPLICEYDEEGGDFDQRDVMVIVKKVFPNIPFIGCFNDAELQYFGKESSKDDANQELVHTMCLSILILTYD